MCSRLYPVCSVTSLWVLQSVSTMADTDSSKHTSSSSSECSDYKVDHEFEPYQFEPVNNLSNSGSSEDENDLGPVETTRLQSEDW